jgi:hypothetical protein
MEESYYYYGYYIKFGAIKTESKIRCAEITVAWKNNRVNDTRLSRASVVDALTLLMPLEPVEGFEPPTRSLQILIKFYC